MLDLVTCRPDWKATLKTLGEGRLLGVQDVHGTQSKAQEQTLLRSPRAEISTKAHRGNTVPGHGTLASASPSACHLLVPP